MSRDVFATSLRSGLAGALRAGDVGRRVTLGGWAHRVRNLGGIVFLDLRDRAGIVQVSFGTEWTAPAVIAAAAAVGVESVVLVEGTVVARSPETRNPEMGTGDVEVQATVLRLVGPAATPAIPVARGKGEKLAAEELRLRHRHLDLRRGELQSNLELRHRLLQRARVTLTELGFLEIETPILTRPTPEGARDYLVPSRIHPGEFYALPQSPQLYKQLLMVSGYDRYFQVARCFRDEDLRHDRQPEFTQIDLEASFVTADDIYAVTEAVLVALWAEAGHQVQAPFPRLAYRDAMERFGSDKPDLRFRLEIADVSARVGEASAEFLRSARARGERVRAIVTPGGAALTRKDFDQLTDEARTMRASGLLWAKRGGDGLTGPGAKAMGTPLLESLALRDGDAVVACAGSDGVVSPALGRVRLELVRRLRIAPVVEHAFVWIEQFPMFERDLDTGERAPMHHPFTAPHPDDLGLLESEPDRSRSTHYDPVYNGVELGSGSIRIVDVELQQAVLARLGMSHEEARRRFGFLLEGLAAGAPPHGGIALGFDRIVMLLAGATSLRDVIAFPKTTQARGLFEDAPAPVPPEQIEELRLRCETPSAEGLA